MMKKTFTFKLWGVLLLMIFAFMACEQEDEIKHQKDILQTVSVDAAQQVVEAMNLGRIQTKGSEKDSEVMTFDWKNLTQEDLSNSNAKMTTVPVSLPGDKGYTRALFITIQDSLHKILFTMYPTETTESGNFTGYIIERDFSRKLVKGFRIAEGNVVAILKKKQKIVCRSGKSEVSEDEDAIYDWGAGLEESVVITHTIKEPQHQLKVVFGATTGGNNGIFGAVGGYDLPATWNYGGGAPNSNNSFSKILVDNNSTPCEKVTNVGKHLDTKSLMKKLQGKVTDNKEHGYILETTEMGIQGHYINGNANDPEIGFSINTGKIDGYIHSHYTGTLSVFSPADIFAIAQIYKKGKIRDLNTFVAGVVTSQGTQYLMVIDDIKKFTNFANTICDHYGNLNIITDYYSKRYNGMNIKETNDTVVNECNFVSFLTKHSLGLKLLKGTKDLNKWTTQELDKKGKVVSKDCN